ncbi:MAG: ATP-binding protein [Acidimicrobiales bacterium]
MLDNLTVRNKFLIVALVPAACFVALAVLGFTGGSPAIGGIALASAALTVLVAYRIGDRAAKRVAVLAERLDGLDGLDADATDHEGVPDEPAADEIGATERAATDLIERVTRAQESHHRETTAKTRSLLDATASENIELISQQLDAIDWLEAREDDSARLDRMFRLDHVAARLHRNAVRLLVLADRDATHDRSSPAPMADVIRVAMGKMEDFASIELRTLDEVMIAPNAACEVTQLVSELLANSLAGSADDTPIEIHAAHLDDGSYRVTIIDRGDGMTADSMATAQARVETPAEIGDLPDHRIGLSVVGRLARRLGADVDFSETAGSGVTVDLKLPAEVVAAATVVRPVSTKHVDEAQAKDRAQDNGTVPLDWTPPASQLRTSEKRDLASNDLAAQERAFNDLAFNDLASNDRAAQERAPQERAAQERAPQERAIENPVEEDRVPQDRAPETSMPTPPTDAPAVPDTASTQEAWQPPPTPPRSNDTAGLVPDRQQAPAPEPLAAEAEHQPGAQPAVLTKRTRRAMKPAKSSGPPVRVSSRSPKKTRSMITSYRKGLQQGRDEAPEPED